MSQTRSPSHGQIADLAFRPLTHTSLAWYLWTALLLAMVGAGTAAYAIQIQRGLVVTGMSDTVIWGIYISNFVFFSGVSMAGTFISAILRITGAEWRRPLTRLAELTTVSALMMCALMPAVDIGRPDRLPYLIRYGRLDSPLIWDLIFIPTYLAGGALYLYLFIIPDATILRDRLNGKISRLPRRIYSIAAFGWHGLPAQKKKLEFGVWIMTLLVIPLGVATHSVVSWIFGLTFRAGWDSTIFAPYFAVGALYSGTAMLITVMVIVRKVYRLEAFLTEKHFRYLSFMLVAFGLIYLYFTFAEYLTVAYKQAGSEKQLLQELFTGRYSLLVWPFFFFGQIVPLAVAALPWTRTIPLLLIVSIMANVGMWVKRYLIVVPSLADPQLPAAWGIYTPTWIEGAVTLASFAGFALVFMLFAKLFPIVSIWEIEEGEEKAKEKVPGAQAASPTATTAMQPGGVGDA